MSNVNFNILLEFQDTEQLLRNEAKLTDDDVKQEPASQTESQVSHALAAYKR